MEIRKALTGRIALALGIGGSIVIAAVAIQALDRRQSTPAGGADDFLWNTAGIVKPITFFHGATWAEKARSCVLSLGASGGTCAMPNAARKQIFFDTNIFDGVPTFRFVRILFGSGTYVFSVGQAPPGPVLWEGQGQSSIVYFNGHGALFTFSFPSNGLAFPVSAGVRDLYIAGPGLESDTVGLQIGAEPSGNGFGAGVTVRDTAIRQFGRGVAIGNNAYNIGIERAFLEGSRIGVDVPEGLTNSGESIDIQDSFIADGYCGISVSSPGFEFWISNTSIDFFHNFGIGLTANALVTASSVNFEGVGLNPFIMATDGSVSVVGGQFVSDAQGTERWPAYVSLSGPARFSDFGSIVASFGPGLGDFVSETGTGEVTISGNHYQPDGAVMKEAGHPIDTLTCQTCQASASKCDG